MLTVIGLRQFGISCCERYVTLTLAVNKKKLEYRQSSDKSVKQHDKTSVDSTL